MTNNSLLKQTMRPLELSDIIPNYNESRMLLCADYDTNEIIFVEYEDIEKYNFVKRIDDLVYVKKK